MKKLTLWRLAPALLLLIPLLSCRTETIEAAPPQPPPVILVPFYGVGPELDAELKKIVLADAQIQELIRDKSYSHEIDGHTVTDTDYNIAVGVYLLQDITGEQFNAWLDEGRKDSPLIMEYVGVLNIGYNEKYGYKIDKANGLVTGFIRTDSGQYVIPEISADDKTRALEIALADDTVRELLTGKEYVVAPEGKIGVWHQGKTRLGVSFQIEFARPYEIDILLPRYGAVPSHFAGRIDAVIISVLLEEGRVASITPRAPIN